MEAAAYREAVKTDYPSDVHQGFSFVEMAPRVFADLRGPVGGGAEAFGRAMAGGLRVLSQQGGRSGSFFLMSNDR